MKRKDRENDVDENPPKKRKVVIPPNKITTLIRLYSSSTVQKRARQFVPLVKTVFRSGHSLKSHIFNSGSLVYRVEIVFTSTWDICKSSCTCEYEGMLYCEHVVATLMVVTDFPDKIVDINEFKEQIIGCEQEKLAYTLLKLLDSQNDYQLLLVGEQKKILENAPACEDINLQDFMDSPFDEDIDDDGSPQESVLRFGFGVNELSTLFVEFCKCKNKTFQKCKPKRCSCGCHSTRQRVRRKCDCTFSLDVHQFGPIVEYIRAKLDFFFLMCREKQYRNASLLLETIMTKFYLERENVMQIECLTSKMSTRPGQRSYDSDDDDDDRPSDNMDNIEKYYLDISSHFKRHVAEVVFGSETIPKDVLVKFAGVVKTWVEGTNKPWEYVQTLISCMNMLQIIAREKFEDTDKWTLDEDLLKLVFMRIFKRKDYGYQEKANEVLKIAQRTGQPFFALFARMILSKSPAESNENLQRIVNLMDYNVVGFGEVSVLYFMAAWASNNNFELVFKFLTEIVDMMKILESTLTKKTFPANMKSPQKKDHLDPNEFISKRESYRSKLENYMNRLFKVLIDTDFDLKIAPYNQKLVDVGLLIIDRIISLKQKQSMFPSAFVRFLFKAKLYTSELSSKIGLKIVQFPVDLMENVLGELTNNVDIISPKPLAQLTFFLMRKRFEEAIKHKYIWALSKTLVRCCDFMSRLKDENIELEFVWRFLSVWSTDFGTAEADDFEMLRDAVIVKPIEGAMDVFKKFQKTHIVELVTNLLEAADSMTNENCRLLFIQVLLEMTYSIEPPKPESNYYMSNYNSEQQESFREMRNDLTDLIITKLFEIVPRKRSYKVRIAVLALFLGRQGDKNYALLFHCAEFLAENPTGFPSNINFGFMKKISEILEKLHVDTQEKLAFAIGTAEFTLKIAQAIENQQASSYEKTFQEHLCQFSPTVERLTHFKQSYGSRDFNRILHHMFRKDQGHVLNFPLSLTSEQLSFRFRCYLSQKKYKAIHEVVVMKTYGLDAAEIMRSLVLSEVGDEQLRDYYMPVIAENYTLSADIILRMQLVFPDVMRVIDLRNTYLKESWSTSTNKKVIEWLGTLKKIFEALRKPEEEFVREMQEWKSQCRNFLYRNFVDIVINELLQSYDVNK